LRDISNQPGAFDGAGQGTHGEATLYNTLKRGDDKAKTAVSAHGGIRVSAEAGSAPFA